MPRRSYPPPRNSPSTPMPPPTCTRRPRPTGWGSGRSRRTGCRGRHRSPTCSTGRTHRSRSGSSAASSTWPTTAWTATSRPATATASRSTGKASRSETARTLTYSDLLAEVSQAANALTDLGLEAGDRVAIYMPMVPEAIVAMLACARLGVMHSVVFAGFSAAALRARIEDAAGQAADHHRRAVSPRKRGIAEGGGRRGGQRPGLRRACPGGAAHRHRRAVDRGSRPVVARHRRRRPHPSTPRSRSTPSIRCSCSTRRAPPASPRASCTPPAGYLTQASYTHYNVFDVKPETDVFWCTADIGWVTGHTLHRVRPAVQRRDAKSSTRATPGLADRASALPGDRKVRRHNLLHGAHAGPHVHEVGSPRSPMPTTCRSLRLLGSVGEPINPEAWRWYRDGVRRRPHPDRRHVVADRDRRSHDLAAARRDRDQARARR